MVVEADGKEALARGMKSVAARLARAVNWERLEGKRASRISFTRPGGGYRTPEELWPSIQDEIVATMNRLEVALRPFLKQLRIGTLE